tara:strand:- start:4318 stop:4899 length:582 start_codon:yes stop_codon:yes gene_type:complete
MIRDKNIEYKYMNLWLPGGSFDLISGSNGPVDPMDAVDKLAELGSTGIVGLTLADGIGDEAGFITMPTPTYIDWDNDVFYRVLYGANNTTSTSFELSASETAFGAAPKLIGDVTAFATCTSTPVANVLSATPWAKTDSSTTDGVAGTSDMLRFHVKCTANTGGGIIMVGLEIRYLPKLTNGPQVNNQPAPTDA